MAPRSKTGTLNIVIAGDPSGAQRAMKVVSADAQGLTNRLSGMAATAGAFLGGAALVRWGTQSVNTYRTVGGEMLKLQRLTGATEETVSGLWVAAQQSGVPIDKLATSLGIFSTKIQSGAAEKLGLDLRNARGEALPLDEALRKVMDRVAKMPAGAERNTLVRTLFGRSGTDLLPLLAKGADALDEYIAKANELGIELNSDDIKAATKNQREFQLAWTATGFVIGKEVLPAATSFMGFVSRTLPPVVGLVTTVADAFNSLPGPIKLAAGALIAIGPAAKLLSYVAVPFKLINSTLVAGRGALDMYRLGLMGVTQQGAGAANMAGRFIATIGPGGVAAGVAGLALVTYGYMKIQEQAQRAKQDTSDFIALLNQGKSPAEAFREQLALTFSGQEGGFSNLKGSAKDFFDTLESAGVDTKSLPEILAGDDADMAKLEQQLGRALGISEERIAEIRAKGTAAGGLSLSENEFAKAIENLQMVRVRGVEAVEQQKIYEETLGESADTAGEFATATEEQTSALERAKKAVESLTQKQQALRSAQDAVVSAHRESVDAQEALSEARRAAAGDSDEYRSAVEAIADAEAGVVDAQEAVSAAERDALSAREDLNRAQAEAKERLVDLAQAARDAVLAEADAQLRVREAQQELERARASGASGLEQDRAAMEVAKAQEAARQATEDRSQAERENQAAQKAGVVGDQAVVDARRQVAEADRRVVDAEGRVAEARRKVGDAERAAAKVITDARAEVAEAQQKAEEAQLREIEAWGDLAVAQQGPINGMKAYRDLLAGLADDLDPNSTLAQRVQALLRDAQEAVSLGQITASGRNPTTTVPPTRDPDAGPRSGGRSTDGLPAGDGAAVPGGGRSGALINQTLVLQGTPTQQRRAAASAAAGVLDRAVREGRFG